MSGQIFHHAATGIHPAAYINPAPPLLPDDAQDGVLWIDTSIGPPYQINLWDAASATWIPLGPAGALLWDAENGTWTQAALDYVGALFSADIADASHGPYLYLSQAGELRFQLDPVSGLFVAVTYHEDGTFDGSGATIQGGLQVINSLARLSHQKSILQLVDLNTLEVVDQFITNGAFYLLGPHNRPNTDYQLDGTSTLEWTGASHPPTGVLALDGGEDVNNRAVRLGVLNATPGPDNDVLWALCVDTYGGLTTPALGAAPGQILGYKAPLAPDTNARLVPLDAASVAPVPAVGTPEGFTCTQVRCGAADALANKLVDIYHTVEVWVQPALTGLLVGFFDALAGAGFTFTDLLTDGLGLALTADEIAMVDVINRALGLLSAGVLGDALPYLNTDQQTWLKQAAFDSLVCTNDSVQLDGAQMDAWYNRILNASGDPPNFGFIQQEVLYAIVGWGRDLALSDWAAAANTGAHSPSSACDDWS